MRNRLNKFFVSNLETYNMSLLHPSDFTQLLNVYTEHYTYTDIAFTRENFLIVVRVFIGLAAGMNEYRNMFALVGISCYFSCWIGCTMKLTRARISYRHMKAGCPILHDNKKHFGISCKLLFNGEASAVAQRNILLAFLAIIFRLLCISGGMFCTLHHTSHHTDLPHS